MRHELEVFLDLRMRTIRYKGQGHLSFGLGVTAGTNMALACGKGRNPVARLGIMTLMRILVFDGRSPVKPLPVLARWGSSQFLSLIKFIEPKDLVKQSLLRNKIRSGWII